MITKLADGLQFKPATSRTGLVPFFKRASTTDNTTTKLASLNVAEGESICIFAKIVGVQSDYSDQIVVVVEAGARRAAAGNVTLTGTPTVRILESSASTNATVTADTTNQNVDINIIGITSENWTWEIFGDYFKV